MARKKPTPPFVGGPAVDSISCPFKILVDSREQKAYTFATITADADQGNRPIHVETIRTCLKYGDYGILEAPNFCLERKSLADLYGSIARRANWIGRLEAMSDGLAHAKIIVEAELSTVLSHPPPFTKIRPKTVSRTIQAWSQRFPKVHWVFLPDRTWAEKWAYRELERWFKDHQGK